MELLQNYTDFLNEPLSRIVGGNDALRGEFPHQIQLRYFGDHVCGGSIISTLLILTAAHCINLAHKRRLQVVSGEHRLSYNDSTEQYRDVQLTLVHEEYNDRTFENDIGIVVLKSPLDFDKYTQSVLVPDGNFTWPDHAFVSGWGRMENKAQGSSDTLQQVKVPIANKTTCVENYGLIGRSIKANMICAGSKSKDSCKGDSGGPLTCIDKQNGTKYLCGIVSFGIGCGLESFAGIYTDVSKYYDWIQAKSAEIRANNFCPPDSFRCKNHKCIPKAFQCDQDGDCEDGPINNGVDSDEENCTFINTSNININNNNNINSTNNTNGNFSYTPSPSSSSFVICRLSQFRCNMSHCIPYHKKCNGVQDCENNRDELYCSHIFNFQTNRNNTQIYSWNRNQTSVNNTKLNSVQNSNNSSSIILQVSAVNSTTQVINTTLENSSIPQFLNFTEELNTTLPSYTATTTKTTTTPPNFTTPLMGNQSHVPIINNLSSDTNDLPNFTSTTVGPMPLLNTSVFEVPATSTTAKTLTVLNTTEKNVTENGTFINTNTTTIKVPSTSISTTGSFGSPSSFFTTTSRRPTIFSFIKFCSRYKFLCKTSGECISWRWRCDKIVDCKDGSDEIGCPDSLDSLQG